jgi:hypothetical protein
MLPVTESFRRAPKRSGDCTFCVGEGTQAAAAPLHAPMPARKFSLVHMDLVDPLLATFTC